ncbi:glutamate receptor ionotropic, kainate 2-like isoform X2 [Chelonus insularis]|nr:glutamate receptor ionotropic, kainate 2-like isoform X2 [Chelonus insularis]XP_034944398.1 glutamate receptor ionotropic, kainate 2-like isoform X2 [Chelonus insularis]XP_034944402.1 glutamate receptor ionotropic, kainate 2-like isoform X2 [Chelonus insularis]
MDDPLLPHTTINMYPDSEKISDALVDILKAMSWLQYTVVYETDDGLSRLQKALWKHGPTNFPITVRQLKPTYDKSTHEPDYRPLLKEVANSTDFSIIFDVEPENLWSILKQAQEVKLLKDYYNYIITCLHIPRDELLLALNGSEANVTAIQIIADDSYSLPTVESAFLFDSIFLFNDALEALNARLKINGHQHLKIEPEPLSCSDTVKYEAGHNISALMKEIASVGRTTGYLKFNEKGGRSFQLNFIEYHMGNAFVSANWQDGEFNVMRTQKEREESVSKSIEQRVFRVTTKPGEPWAMEVTDGSTRGFPIEDKRWEGYAFDLIHEMAEILKFKYVFEIVPDEQYGVYDENTKQWTGLIGRLLSRAADLAICDLTITQVRESAVDFTMPFMNLGISILFAKPDNKVPELFSFLSPFSTDVWIYMATAYLAVSIMFYIQARASPDEWQSPHPCVSEPEELENNFTLKNSFWITVGSLMQQGSDVAPTAGSIRTVGGVWWFFTLIIVSSYTANLAAFLTSVKMDESISNVEELASQNKIKYGAVKGGSTAAYFRGSNVSTYQKMWQTMMDAKPSVFTKTNVEGLDRVAKGKRTYAFLMESTSIEYAVERNCNLMPVGGLLDNKGYGIAVPPNSPYRTQLSLAILKLQEQGVLRELKTKWWKRGSKNCSQSEPPPDSGELTMAHVGGVFLVLLIGCSASLLMAIFEFLWNIRKVAIQEKITPKEAFMAELKFAIDVTADTKPIKISRSRNASGSSSDDNRLTRAASTARSFVGSFLRLDILDKVEKDKENNSNNKKTII